MVHLHTNNGNNSLVARLSLNLKDNKDNKDKRDKTQILSFYFTSLGLAGRKAKGFASSNLPTAFPE